MKAIRYLLLIAVFLNQLAHAAEAPIHLGLTEVKGKRLFPQAIFFKTTRKLPFSLGDKELDIKHILEESVNRNNLLD